MTKETRLSLQGTIAGRIGFGCWQLAGAYASANGRPNGYGDIDEAEGIRAIHYALDNGINFFDTAIGYNDGHSERVLGKALVSYTGSAGVRPVICTKYEGWPGMEGLQDFAADMERNVDMSLQRLGMKSLDMLLLHNPPDDLDLSAMDLAPFERMVAAGKIKEYGVSCRTVKGVANVLEHGFGSVVEAVYNVLDRRYEPFFAHEAYARYTFICRVPLASGFVSPRTLAEDRVFAGNDIRSNFSSEQVEWVTGAVRSLAFLNELEGGITVSALRFQLSNPYRTIAIPGIKNVRQAADAALAMRLGPLPQDVVQRIADAVPEVFYKWR
ncbi:aldo/keto reductase [Nemorincola caseinilytica]|uniref:Aldo/keto reductase n=1 Tax=Nemorincola caseinilytica TaxID=2054315 RepID=A0ABP8N936_9BACT